MSTFQKNCPKVSSGGIEKTALNKKGGHLQTPPFCFFLSSSETEITFSQIQYWHLRLLRHLTWHLDI